MDSYREILLGGWKAVYSGDWSIMDLLFSEDYVHHSDDGDLSREEFKDLTAAFNSAFPDVRFEIEDTLEEGMKVCYRWRATGTHLGPYLGVPPTNKPMVTSGITISRFERTGQIAEDWASWDRLHVLRALGVNPITTSSTQRIGQHL
jgi:steroid delta-isomerase-like uncharacterized protein